MPATEAQPEVETTPTGPITSMEDLARIVAPEHREEFSRFLRTQAEDAELEALRRDASAYRRSQSEAQLAQALEGLPIDPAKFLAELKVNGQPLSHEVKLALAPVIQELHKSLGVHQTQVNTTAVEQQVAEQVGDVFKTIGYLTNLQPTAAAGAPLQKSAAEQQQEKKNEAFASGSEDMVDQMYAEMAMGQLGKPAAVLGAPQVVNQ